MRFERRAATRQGCGHAYGSIYSGPIGAIVTPQLQSMEHSRTLPYASSLCGACYEVCPVKINIPEILLHLRNKVVEQGSAPFAERVAMKVASVALSDSGSLSTAQQLVRIAQRPFVHDGTIRSLPGVLNGWSSVRDLNAVPKQSFREWWAEREEGRKL
jgi:L-lactate dehydrogenase complex protein LldF